MFKSAKKTKHELIASLNEERAIILERYHVLEEICNYRCEMCGQLEVSRDNIYERDKWKRLLDTSTCLIELAEAS